MREEAPSLERLYEEAKAALAGKEYERAISLLREIVVQDAEYLDASQLLAQAIAWQRRRWWQDPRLLFLPAALLLLAALFWAMQPTSPLRMALALPTPTVVIPTSTSTPRPTSTPIPTPTPTPVPTPMPLAWHRLYGGHIFPRDTITAIVVDPEDPKVFYVGTSNAGIYKSIDGGLSWKPAHNGLGRAWIHTLVIDPRDPRTLYAGVSLGGVYKTTDGGETWQAVNDGIEVGFWEEVSVVALDPRDSQHLYYTPSNQIYESLDGGKSWISVRASDCPNQMVDLVVHPTDGKTLFAGAWSREGCAGGVYKSVDAGKTWTLTGLEGQWMEPGGAPEIDSQEGDYLYAVVRDVGLYGSSDGGHNWSRLPQACWQVPAIDPDDGAVAYCGMGVNIMKTADGGWTWQRLAEVDTGVVRVISVSPHDSMIILAGGSGLYVSTDGGVSWVERNSGLGGTRLDLTLAPSDSSILYADGGALYRSSTSGRTWEFFSPGHDLAFDADGTTLYLYRFADDSIFRSRDQGQTWEKLVKPAERMIEDVAAHPRKPGRLYASYGSDSPIGLYISSDGGLTWQAASGMGVIHHPILYFDHDLGEVMYAIGHWSAYHSNDAGNTWEACADPGGWLAHSSQSALAISPRDSNWLILATQGRGVLVSRDGCQSWEPSNNGLGNFFVNTVAIDPQNSNTIYAGTDGGAYVSYDGGEHWGVVNEGLLGATVVYSIVVDPQDPDNVYSATPYGIFRLERR